MARPLRRSINKGIAYSRETLIGVIIFVNREDNWCNVELQNGTVLYQVPFRATNGRLRRVEQPVVLTETHGKRQKYVITGQSDVAISSSAFDPRGNCKWAPDANSGTWSKDGVRYQWK